MRKFNTTDIFGCVTAIEKSGLRSRVEELLIEAAEAEDTTDMRFGIHAILTMIGLFAESGAQDLAYKVLSGPFELEPAEIAALDADALMDGLEAIAKDEGFRRFSKRSPVYCTGDKGHPLS